MNKKISFPMAITIIVVCALMVGGVVVYQYYGMPKEKEKTAEEIPPEEINSFEECVAGGYPILESYPRQCKTPDGRTFTEEIDESDECTEECIEKFIAWCENCRSLGWPGGGAGGSPILEEDNCIQNCELDLPGAVHLPANCLRLQDSCRIHLPLERQFVNFNECSAEGVVSLEIYPCQCTAPNGIMFIQETETESVEDSVEKYIDEDFGFSFYYPKSWELSTKQPYTGAEGLYLLEVGPYEDRISISKYSGERYEQSDAKFGSIAYYYDEDKDQWMEERHGGMMNGEGISTAEPRFYTLSGLPVFVGTGRWVTYIVALSTNEFLIINITGSGWSRIMDPLTKTMARTDQEVDDKEFKKLLIEEICADLTIQPY